MKQEKNSLAALGILFVMLFIIGVGSLIRFSQNLFHFSQNVRGVDIVGVSGGGAAIGVAVVGH